MKTIIALLILCALPLGAFAQKEFVIAGKMMHTDLEGGCWYLNVKDVKYELSGSPEDLAKCYVEYRPVTLRVKPGGMMGSTCMLGKRLIIVEVLDTMFHPHTFARAASAREIGGAGGRGMAQPASSALNPSALKAGRRKSIPRSALANAPPICSTRRRPKA